MTPSTYHQPEDDEIEMGVPDIGNSDSEDGVAEQHGVSSSDEGNCPPNRRRTNSTWDKVRQAKTSRAIMAELERCSGENLTETWGWYSRQNKAEPMIAKIMDSQMAKDGNWNRESVIMRLKALITWNRANARRPVYAVLQAAKVAVKPGRPRKERLPVQISVAEQHRNLIPVAEDIVESQSVDPEGPTQTQTLAEGVSITAGTMARRVRLPAISATLERQPPVARATAQVVRLDGELKVLRRNSTVAYIQDEGTFGLFFGRIAAHRVLKDDAGVVDLNIIGFGSTMIVTVPAEDDIVASEPSSSTVIPPPATVPAAEDHATVAPTASSAPPQAADDSTASSPTASAPTCSIGHAVIATHLKRINTIDDDRRWWCNTDERQTVRHLFKECRRWRSEREGLKKKIKPGLWSHNDMAHMFENKECTEFIMKFIKETEVGNKTKEKDQEEKDEERDGDNGWEELMEHPWVEELHEDDEEDDEELMAWDGDEEGHVTQGNGVG
ncbi:hypothetical protein FPQ18DRAFT_391918 [Pyronema domesticum]|nr:hypothetical protein FPQ18DRAFT_391918 [Pyronema domesticum]